MPSPTKNLNSYTVKELQEMLREQNLSTSGKKKELIARLEKAELNAAAATPYRAEKEIEFEDDDDDDEIEFTSPTGLIAIDDDDFGDMSPLRNSHRIAQLLVTAEILLVFAYVPAAFKSLEFPMQHIEKFTDQTYGQTCLEYFTILFLLPLMVGVFINLDEYDASPVCIFVFGIARTLVFYVIKPSVLSTVLNPEWYLLASAIMVLCAMWDNQKAILAGLRGTEI
eukprot:Clim_evm43s231 gene=Clim_evmTU43s231